MKITLTYNEMAELRKLCEDIISSKAPSSKKRYYMDGRADGEARIIRNLEGYMAEKAVSKHLNIPFLSYSIGEDGSDGNVDFEYKGWKIGVKSTRYKKGKLAIKQGEMKKSVVPDVYFLCVVDIENRAVELKGYALTNTIDATNLGHLRKDTEKVYIVEQKDLRSFK